MRQSTLRSHHMLFEPNRIVPAYRRCRCIHRFQHAISVRRRLHCRVHGLRNWRWVQFCRGRTGVGCAAITGYEVVVSTTDPRLDDTR